MQLEIDQPMKICYLNLLKIIELENYKQMMNVNDHENLWTVTDESTVVLCNLLAIRYWM